LTIGIFLQHNLDIVQGPGTPNAEVVRVATVRKHTWTSRGEVKTAWIADFFDQEGKRHIKTCKTKKEADGFLVQARHEVARGLYTPENACITVDEAAKLRIQRGELEKLEHPNPIVRL
jgi:hypothetical protein